MHEATPVSTVLYDGRVVRLVVQETPLPNGTTRRREIVEHADGAAILAVDAEDRVLLVRQLRPAVGQILLELPAGIVESGEDPAECARRELREETGFTSEHLEPLASFYPSPGFCTERLHVYLATGLREGTSSPDADEQLDVVREPLSLVLERLAAGEISDAKTVVGLLAYQQRQPFRAARHN